jgi:hypothetical protein
MSTVSTCFKEVINGISPKTRRRITWTLAIVFVLQLYFVRALLAAELLFGLLFAMVFALAAICYLIGTLGEQGLNWADTGIRVTANAARRSYGILEEISKKPFRHPHSESAR